MLCTMKKAYDCKHSIRYNVVDERADNAADKVFSNVYLDKILSCVESYRQI